MSLGLNLGPVVGMFALDSITLTRTPLTYVSGVTAAGAPSTVTARAAVQPASGRDLARLPEAQRTGGGVAVFATVPLQLQDAFVWRGQNWTIVHLEPWDGTGYWRATAVQTGAI